MKSGSFALQSVIGSPLLCVRVCLPVGLRSTWGDDRDARPPDGASTVDGGRRRRSGRASSIVSSEIDQKMFIENVGVLRGRLSRTS